MNAYCFIRQDPVYRREAFLKGLAAAGVNVSNAVPARPGPNDVLVIWNRYGDNEELGARFERGGGRVIVAENGYIGFGGLADHRPQDGDGRRMYALALHDHNGRGEWPRDDGARWQALGIELEAWRTPGDRVVVIGQRGIGSRLQASPAGWAEKTADEIRKQLRVPVYVRPHPGENAPKVPLERDLAGARCVVVWASAAGVKALIAGVPVFHACECWVAAPGARRYRSPADLLTPVLNDEQRLAAMHRLACAQWTVDEITSGAPFRQLLALPYRKAA